MEDELIALEANGNDDLALLRALEAESDSNSDEPNENTFEAKLNTTKPSIIPRLKSAPGIVVSAAGQGTAPKPLSRRAPQPTADFVEEFSKIRVEKRVVGSEALRNHLEGSEFVRLGRVGGHSSGKGADWVTIAILAHKAPPRTSRKGDKYAVWRLSDFRVELTLMVFGDAFKSCCKFQAGDLLCVANPRQMEPRDGHSRGKPAFSVSSAHQMLRIGRSKDFGYCCAYRKDSFQRCQNYIDTRSREYCDAHIAQQYKKAMAKRMDVNRAARPTHTPLRVDPNARKGAAYRRADGVMVGVSSRASTHITIAKRGRRRIAPGHTTMSSVVQGARAKSHTSRFVRRLVKSKPAVSAALVATTGAAQSKKERPSVTNVPAKRRAVTEDRVLAQSRQIAKRRKRLGGISRRGSKHPGAVSLAAATATPSQARKRARRAQDAVGGLKQRMKDVERREALLKREEARIKLEKQQLANARARLQKEQHTTPASAQSSARSRVTRPVLNMAAFRPVRPRSTTATPAEIARKRAVELLREKKEAGTLSDCITPSSTEAGPSFSLSRERSRRARGGAPPSLEFEAHFGSVKMDADRATELLNARSRHQDVYEQSRLEEVRRFTHSNIEKEEAVEKVSKIRKKKILAWHCGRCDMTTEYLVPTCKARRHPVKRVPAVKRFFECVKCHRRTWTLNRKLPGENCLTCGSRSYTTASVVAVPKAFRGEAPAEELEVCA